MILSDERAPRWIRELSRFIHLKSLLVLHGNVLDRVSYPVQRAGTDNLYWTESNMEVFCERFLIGLGYQVVGVVDPLDGLSFPDPEMQRLSRGLLSARNVAQESVSGREAGPRSRALRSRGSTDPGCADLIPTTAEISALLQNRETPCAFVFTFASRLLSAPDALSRQELALFTQLLKASQDSQEVVGDQGRWNNVIILVCDKMNDMPVFLYINNPRARSIAVDKPDAQERTRFIESTYRAFHGASGANPTQELASQFSALTDGFCYYEMMSLIGLSLRESIPIAKIQNLCERFKYGIVESAWDKIDKRRLLQAEQYISSRIKGQDFAVARMLEMIKRARLGLAAGSGQSQRPRGTLFFAGPTGVGKTEMAKVLATFLFGHEDRLVRFDMSEYAAAHADQRLLGAPPGYVGYEEGGQLTNAIKDNPFSVLLFDEIEKAHPAIFDKFLQILDDGRITDGKGDTVYFSECIIIFTSNLGTVSRSRDDSAARQLVSPESPYEEVQAVILEAIREHFNFTLGRPEILNRFGDNFVVFDFIRPPVDEYIVDLLLDRLCSALKQEKRIVLTLSEAARGGLVNLAGKNLVHGGRGIRNAVDSALVNPLAAWLFDHDISTDATLYLEALTDRGETTANRFQLHILRADE